MKGSCVATLSQLYFETDRTAQQRGTLCVMALLAWVSACDGVTPGEKELLSRVFDGDDEADDLKKVLELSRAGSVNDLELASRHVQRTLGRGRRRLLLELAVAVAFQDAKLSTPENHALQYLADLLGVKPKSFFKLYRTLTGHEFPPPDDLDSAEWWRRRDAGEKTEGLWQIPDGSPILSDVTIDTPPLSRREALRILGLNEGADKGAIHAAYHRAAMRRHPDRFANLGPAAVAVAAELFQRVNLAHKMLAGQ